MDSVHEATAYLIELVKVAPSWISALVLFLCAWVEYVLPPFPGDTVMVAGGFFAAKGSLSFPLVFFALLFGSVFGESVAFFFGRLSLYYGWTHKLIDYFFKPESQTRLQGWFERHGNWLLLCNRFLPGVRGPVMMMAGIAQVSFTRVLIWGTCSAILWNSLLMLLGYWFSHNFDHLLEFFTRYTQIVATLLVVFVLFKLFKTRL